MGHVQISMARSRTTVTFFLKEAFNETIHYIQYIRTNYQLRQDAVHLLTGLTLKQHFLFARQDLVSGRDGSRWSFDQTKIRFDVLRRNRYCKCRSAERFYRQNLKSCLPRIWQGFMSKCSPWYLPWFCSRHLLVDNESSFDG